MKRAVGLLLVVLACVRSAAADDVETGWGKGVSAEQRAAAEAKLQAGNAEFLQNRFREALDIYQQALASWDHPAIRFNVVRCLIALDRPLEAEENLERALAYGKEPFEEQIYTEALNYQRLLAGQVAKATLTCTQPGVTVKLDGKLVGTCPGSVSQKLLPGVHVLVAQAPGFETLTRDVVLLGGKTQVVDVKLKTVAEATVYETRWKTWKPWALAGAGLAVGGIGVLVDQQGRGQLDQLQLALLATCSTTECTRMAYNRLEFRATEDAAIRKNRIGIGLMVAGGAVIATGIVGVILNRPRPVVKKRHETMSLSPASIGNGGLALQGAF